MWKGKPFTDGAYIKGCMLSVAKELFNDLTNKDKITQKSARTVHDRAPVMARQIEDMQIKTSVQVVTFHFPWMSLPM